MGRAWCLAQERGLSGSHGGFLEEAVLSGGRRSRNQRHIGETRKETERLLRLQPAHRPVLRMSHITDSPCDLLKSVL